MGVSVVIPCLNEEKYIEECVQSILDNGFILNELEVIVVDGGSKDATLEKLAVLQKRFPQIRVENNPYLKTPFALNIGVKSSKFEYILIAGAHAFYPKGYIKHLYNQLQMDEIDVVGGALQTETKHNNPKTRAIRVALTHRFGVGNATFRTGTNILQQVDTVPFGLYKKQIFESCGYYNERLIRNHDMELSKRILRNGFKIWLDPQYVCTYYARESFAELAKNNFANGLWNVKTLFITRNFSSLSLRHYVPLIFLLSLIVPLVLGVVWKPLIILSLCSLFSYILLISVLAFQNKAKSNFPLVFWSFVTLHFAYGYGSLVGFLKR